MLLQTTQQQQLIKQMRECNYNSDSIFSGFTNNPNEITLGFCLPFLTTHTYQCLVRKGFSFIFSTRCHVETDTIENPLMKSAPILAVLHYLHDTHKYIYSS